MRWFDTFKGTNKNKDIKKILQRAPSLEELSNFNHDSWDKYKSKFKSSTWQIPNFKEIIGGLNK
jgi:hypothetical protein